MRNWAFSQGSREVRDFRDSRHMILSVRMRSSPFLPFFRSQGFDGASELGSAMQDMLGQEAETWGVSS